jgi:uncharacterized membrane protein YkvA (DUF1232 family)
MPRVTSWLARPRLLRALLSQVRLAVRLLRDPTVPLLTKMLPMFAALYVVSPLDFVPDIIPVIGQLDDLGVLAVALEAFLKLCPPGATEFHRAAIGHGLRYSPAAPPDDFIDAEWRRE